MTQSKEIIKYEHHKEVSEYIEAQCPAYAAALRTCHEILKQWMKDHPGTCQIFEAAKEEKMKQFQEGGESENNTEP